MADPTPTPTQVLNEIEQTISQRIHARAQIPQVEERTAAALAEISDELARLRGEVKILRYLFATYSTRPDR
jgi:hypothetical protein